MAYCSQCGTSLSPAAVSCPQCGHPIAGASGVAPNTDRRVEGFAIASLACAAGGFFIVPLVGSILGIVFGGMARDRLARDPSLEGDGLATAGIIVGWVGLAVSILTFVVVILFFVAFASSVS